MQCAIKYNADPINNVINLSNKSITIYEFKLLDKNLNFYPTPNRYNKAHFPNDTDAFTRKIKLQAYFQNTEQNLGDGQFRVSPNKTWAPKGHHHSVETLTQAFRNNLEKE